MKAMGIRISPKEARYAVVEYDRNKFSLVNENDESRLRYPVNIVSPFKKTDWLYRELERIFCDHKGIEKVCIKTNEYMHDSKSKRESAYLEGGVILFCAQKGISGDIWIYKSLGTNNSDVKQDAEQRVGVTKMYWDKKIADAVVAAWKGVKP